MPDLSVLNSILPNLADIAVYAAIAIVTLIGVIKCLLPLWNTTHALHRAIHRLQRDAGTTREKPVWQESRFMGKRLKGSWMRFLQNAEQLDRRGLPCNVEDYINDDTVTHGPGNAQLAELIPNLLTSLGILGTFMGMMQGLTGLDMSNADALINGVPKLLDGMKFAFGTSVAGISCSLVFNMLNRIAQGSSYRAIDDFVENFTQLAMQRPLDNDVQLVCQNQDLNSMIFTATDGLSQQLAGSVELAVTRAMQPVSTSLDNFLVGATRAQIEGVSRIAGKFIEEMNRSLDGQLLALGQTMTLINQHNEQTVDRVGESLEVSAAMLNDVNRMQGVAEGVMARFERFAADISVAQQRTEGFETASASLLEKLHAAADQQQQTLRTIRDYQGQLTAALDRFTAAGTQTLDSISRMGDRSAAHLTDAGESMHDASQQLSRSYQSFVTNVVEGLSRALGLFDQSMTALMATLQEKVDSLAASGTGADVVSQLGDMQRMMTGMEETLRKATESLTGKEG